MRFCGNNTGVEEAHFNGETMCISDGGSARRRPTARCRRCRTWSSGRPSTTCPTTSPTNPTVATGSSTRNGATTLARQHNNDLWSCLDDGRDADLLSDGCLRVAALNDLDAEWTGGFFDATGNHFYVSIQHNATGFGVILDNRLALVVRRAASNWTMSTVLILSLTLWSSASSSTEDVVARRLG